VEFFESLTDTVSDAASEAVASGIARIIEEQKARAIEEAKRELAPFVIGIGVASGVAGALLLSAFRSR